MTTLRYTMPLTEGDDRELVAARFWLLGAVGVQELPDSLVVWFEHRLEDVPPGGVWAPEPHRDWLATWREDIEPVRAGRVVVVPTWLLDDHEPASDELTIALDPGLAFGSGHHATTQLCLEALQRVPTSGAAVLDVGSGTGVLAIAARMLGADPVEAVDVDPEAVRATRVNAEANAVQVDARLGSAGDGDRPADIVLANLLTPTLHALAPALLRAAAPAGVVIASGVASERAEGVLASLTAAGGELVERTDRDGWAAIVVRATGTPTDRDVDGEGGEEPR